MLQLAVSFKTFTARNSEYLREIDRAISMMMVNGMILMIMTIVMMIKNNYDDYKELKTLTEIPIL